MKITWLGQAGLLFETDGKRIVIDPYLSDSCHKKNPLSFRRVPVDDRFLRIQPDIVICTHNHQDHYDEDTLNWYLKGEKNVTCIVSPSCLEPILKYGRRHNYICFPPATQWTEGNVRFTSVKAVHSDRDAIGVIIEAEGKKYYITGDTLYNTDIISSLPKDIYAMFLPVNGVGNNMNFTDAARFIDDVCPETAVPMHVGLLDDNFLSAFSHKKAVIPEFYKEIVLN